MQTGRKLAIKPNPEQQSKLRQWIGCQRHVYNCKVEHLRYQLRLRAMYLAQFPQTDVGYVETDQKYAQCIDFSPFLREVPWPILRNGAYRFAQAVARWNKKLGGRPQRKRKHGRQSVLITSELFSIAGNTLTVGDKKFPVGTFHMNGCMEFETPKMLSVAVDGNKWSVSFCNDDGVEAPSYEELLNFHAGRSKDDLIADAIGIDRGIKIQAACSNGVGYSFSPKQVASLARAEQRRKKYQRQMSRRFKSGRAQSKNYYRAKASKQKAERKIKNIRLDFNHKTSRDLVSQPQTIIVLESLNLKNMTRSVAPKQADDGTYLPNGATAKSGLNKSLLHVAMGQLIQFTQYKALAEHKLVLQTPAPYTSQTCRKCKTVDERNRKSQAEFACIACGHQENADFNASGVIVEGGIDRLIAGYFHEQLAVQKGRKKKTRVGRNAPGPSDAILVAGTDRLVGLVDGQNEATSWAA
jgi:putative transposase